MMVQNMYLDTEYPEHRSHMRRLGSGFILV
jgi:hypothetical protein